jgi:hypothetical protein
MADPRKERIAKNEAAFRFLNEQLRGGVHGSLQREEDRPGFVCECGDQYCEAVIHVPLEKYEEVRSDPALFLLVPGHEIPDTEDVVEQEETYAVVRKHADVRPILDETDPRA